MHWDASIFGSTCLEAQLPLLCFRGLKLIDEFKVLLYYLKSFGWQQRGLEPLIVFEDALEKWIG
jgi:hypothetical protein